MYEKCGIFGIISNTNTIPILFEGLKKLQHRGQDGCGIGYVEKDELRIVKKMGLVTNLSEYVSSLNSLSSIGHVRYATSSKKQCVEELQPLKSKNFLLVHNGNIPFCKDIHDTTYLRNFIESYENIETGLIELINTISGVYNLLLLTKDCIYIVKDRYGFRPLCLTQTPNSLCVMSENIAYPESNLLREIEPGEIVKITSYNSFETLYKYNKQTEHKFCIFENIYFMNPRTIRYDTSVKDFRENLGSLLANQETIQFTNEYIVVGVPRSGIFSGKSYAQTLNLPYEQFILKNENVNRSFIEPTQEKRKQVLRKKFMFKNIPKKIIIVDDTIVRGNTMQKLIELLKERGAEEIHVRIPAPSVVSECFYGVDIASKHELLTYNKSLEDMEKFLNVNSLRFIVNFPKHYSEQKYCMGCFTNNHNKKLLEW